MDNSFAYQPATERYERMQYKYCGRSGLKLPLISLGLWHNFGSVDDFTMATDMIKYAFDHGITHFDLANNYGPVPGSAETNFGRILRENFQGYRDEMIISSKAGHEMWAGPYGGNSSRKNLKASIDQSLRRTGLEYFDIFYTHRYDGVTPVEETIQALIDIVKRGNEFPHPVQTHGTISFLCGERNKCSPRRFPVDLKYMMIFPIMYRLCVHRTSYQCPKQ